MHRERRGDRSRRRGQPLLAGLVMASACLIGSPAWGQVEEPDEGIALGEWTFFPSLELRIRGEYRRDPVDVGGDRPASTAVQANAVQSKGPPVVDRVDPVRDEWVASERARLGLGVRYDVLSAQLTLQDARVLGAPNPSLSLGRSFGVFEPSEAYLDVRTAVEDPWLWVRVGRQSLRWGDGRLVGDNDWSPRGNLFDAARAHVTVDDFDLEVMATMLALPGPVPPPQAFREPVAEATGTGTQLYGLQAAYRFHALFGAEVVGLARFVRDPLPLELLRGDTYTVDLRLFGEERGLTYAVEGAYQLGRVAGFGDNRSVDAFAAAARVDWQTAAPGDLKLGVRGAYASGDGSDPNGPGGRDLGRFDPIAPTTHEHHGTMDLYAWSNVIEGGTTIAAKPHEVLTTAVGYGFVALAEPTGRWTTASLVPVGADPTNDNRILGHEVDVVLDVQPWDYASFGAGYGLFLLGGGGRAILSAAGRGDRDLLHYGYLQATVHAP